MHAHSSLFSIAQSCGKIGNDDDSELRERTERRFYLDINNPATCNGTITSWTVCYYGPGQATVNTNYWATYAVYRRSGSGGGERYERVSGIFSAVRATADVIRNNLEPLADGLIQEGGFLCYNDSVDTSNSPLPVQAGDIIGACVFDPQDGIILTRRQLHIVGEGFGEVLENYVTDACTTDTIPSSILRSDFQIRNNRMLHIYANIGIRIVTIFYLQCSMLNVCFISRSCIVYNYGINFNP